MKPQGKKLTKLEAWKYLALAYERPVPSPYEPTAIGVRIGRNPHVRLGLCVSISCLGPGNGGVVLITAKTRDDMKQDLRKYEPHDNVEAYYWPLTHAGHSVRRAICLLEIERLEKEELQKEQHVRKVHRSRS